MSSSPDHSAIRRAILDKYRKVARSPEGLFAYVTGLEGAQARGYDDEILSSIPAGLVRSFCGVGNPHALGAIAGGERVLDVGCGSGMDLLVGSRRVGPAGKVFGVDPTPEMVALATGNAMRFGAQNIEVVVGRSEALPFDADVFDVVISNGVLNLSPGKKRSFEEIRRVLRPGGRLQFADIVLDESLPEEIVGSLEAWSN